MTSGAGMKTISTKELKEMMDRGDDFLLLEVLGEASYERAHLPGAFRFRNLRRPPGGTPRDRVDH